MKRLIFFIFAFLISWLAFAGSGSNLIGDRITSGDGTKVFYFDVRGGTLSTVAGTLTLTNKTMSGASNTFSNIPYSALLLSNSVTNSDLAGSISDSKLSTISTAGKVANSATTATSSNTASAIVARDANGDFTARNINGATVTATTFSGAFSGNATTATQLAADPTDCSANNFATAINALGNLTCAQVAFSQITGTVSNSQLAGSIAATKLIGTDISTLGTVTSGTWNATVIGKQYGGSGQDNSSLTFPSSGTLTTTTSASTLTSKTLTAPVINNPVITGGTIASVQMNGATLSSPSITTPTGLVKGDVGLGNVDNTSDATKNSAAVSLTNKAISLSTMTGGTLTGIQITTATLTNPTVTGTQTTGGTLTSVQITGATLSSPVMTSPSLGTPASGVMTNVTGTAAGLTAGNVTTNANLTGPITSVGNATSVASQTGTGTKFVMDTSPTLVTPTLTSPTVNNPQTTGGTLTSVNISSATETSPTVTDAIRFSEQSSTPSTPSAGYGKFYRKNDGKFYQLNSAGAETAVGSGSGGGGFFSQTQNLLSGQSFEDGVLWSASGGSLAQETGAGNFIPPGVASMIWDSNAAGQTLSSNTVTITANGGLSGRNGVISLAVKASSLTATHLLEVIDGSGNTLTDTSNATIASSTTGFTRTSKNFIFPASGTVYARLKSVAADEPKIYIDDAYFGLAELFNAGTATSQTAEQSYASTVTTQGFGAPTITSAVWQKQTDKQYIRVKMTLGTNTGVEARVGLANGAAVASTVGTNETVGYWTTSDTTAGVSRHGPILATGGNTYVNFGVATEAGTSNIQSARNGNVFNNTTVLELYAWVPIQGWGPESAYRPDALPMAPTVQRFTSGSGTYTTPTNPRPSYIRIRMVGAGGGGGGSGTGGTIGNNGGSTTFGSSLLTASPGSGGSASSGLGGAGGGTTINSPAIGTGVTGAQGISGGFSANTNGGAGGSSPYGGAGAGGYNAAAGIAASSNTGSGGGGGGGSGSNASTGGGGAGGYIDALISNPSATYSYAVGTGGAAGSAGTGGNAGGAGANGYIEVTEYYGASQYPILTGSVTSQTTNQERVERMSGTCSSSSSISTQTGSWVSSVGNISSGQCSVNLSGTPFSAAPTCTITGDISNTAVWAKVIGTSTSTVTIWGWNTSTTSAATSFTFQLHCMGPR